MNPHLRLEGEDGGLALRERTRDHYGSLVPLEVVRTLPFDMSVLGNILWLICGGLLLGLSYIVGGLLICVTIIGIPFGLQAMKFGVACLTPFGRELKRKEGSSGVLSLVFNVLWILLWGWELACAHLALALLCGITIVGIPFAVQHLKLVPLALVPFGHEFD